MIYFYLLSPMHPGYINHRIGQSTSYTQEVICEVTVKLVKGFELFFLVSDDLVYKSMMNKGFQLSL